MRRLLLLSAMTIAAACGQNGDGTCDDTATCPPDGSTEGGPDAPANCDLSKDPKDSPACIDDSIGIFVDVSSGQDSNAGTKASPMKTIGAALGKTNAQHPRLYICEGTYPEDVIVDASHDGVSIYGGFKCSAWTYSGTKPIVGKTQNAFKLDSLTKAVTVEDLEVDSLDGDAVNLSSVAMFVNASTNVTLTRTKLSAGKGHSGTTGTISPYTYPTQPQLNGNAADGGAGGAAKTVTCPAGDSTTGGKGGDNGFDGNPGAPTLDGGAGGTVVNCINSTQGGGKGANAPGAPNAPKMTTLGSISSTGWSPTTGGGGANGGPGQGGGGGAGTGGGGGGGGGCGGCGGAGGGGGTGGGGSIAIAAVSSTVTINASTLVASAAGDGGAGVAGQTGQTIFGFFGSSTPPGCTGGTGGLGGSGGAGAGGAGGLSVGVLWKGNAAPVLDTASQSGITIASKAGTKGMGGAPGVNDGIDGVAQAIFQAP